MNEAIKVHQLTKTFEPQRNLLGSFSKPKKITALDHVDLTVNSGETFALLGPNGAGKTTLIKTLSTLLLPNSGKASIHGYDVVEDEKKVKSLISLVVGEERSFYWRLTGQENLEFFAKLYGLSKKETEQRIKNIRTQLNLQNLEQRYQEYSTGTKNRLAIARSYLNNAPVLFMDEPTRSLDPKASAELRNWLKMTIKGSKTVFFSTHNTYEAEELADRIAIINHGQIVGCGTLEDLRKQIEEPMASLEKIFMTLTSQYEEVTA